MVHANYFPAGEVTDHLYTLDQAQDILARTEPIAQSSLYVSESVGFNIADDFAENWSAIEADDLIPAFMTANGREMQLTKDSLLDLTSLMGMGRGKYPSSLPGKGPAGLEAQMNHWYKGGLGEKEFKILEINGIARAVVRGGLQPFSNLQVMDNALAAIRARYGANAEVFVDKKMIHNLDKTYMRLVIPEQTRVMERTGTDNDTWSAGVQWKNSLTGSIPTAMDGYMFRYWCKNGSIDVRNEAGGSFSRRGAAGQDDSVYEWARDSVDSILGGLEGALDHVQSLVDVTVDGEAHNVLDGIFADYNVTNSDVKANIIENMLNNPGNMTMYDVMQAITAAANDEDLDPAQAERLMRIGGDVSSRGAARCNLGSLHVH